MRDNLLTDDYQLKFSKKFKAIISITLFLFLLGSASGAPALSAEEISINMEYRDTPVQEVLRTLARISGENIVLDDSVTGRITLEMRDVSFATAFEKILTVKDLDYHRQDDVIIVASPERIDELYREMERSVVTLKHISPAEAREILAEISPEINVKPLPDQNRLILSGLADDLKRTEEILTEVDKPVPEVSSVFELDNISAEEAAAEIRELYPEINVSPRPEYQNILVRGREEKVKEIEELIGEIDRAKPHIRENYLPLHMGVEELVRKVSDLYPREELKVTAGEGVIILEGQPDLVEDAVEIMTELEEAEEDVIHKQVRLDYIGLEEAGEIISQLEADLEVQASEDQRALLIRGKAGDMERALNIVDELDQPLRQVMLDVRVEEISEDEMKDRGISPGELSDFSAIGIEYEDGLPTGIDINAPEIFNVLDEEGATRTMANPSLLSQDGREAELVIGDEVPYEEKDVVDGEIVTVGYNYEEVGITLNFVPTVTDDDTVTLDIEPEVSSITEMGGELVPPQVRTRRFSNTISLRDGQTIAVGGLIQDDVEREMSEIPYLSDLPILGRLFSHEEVVEEETEIIIFITTHIVDIMEDVTPTEDIEAGDNDSVLGEDQIGDGKELNEDYDYPEERNGEEIEGEDQKEENEYGDIVSTSAEEEIREIDLVRQKIFKITMQNRSDWSEVYNFSFTSGEKLSREKLASIYNISEAEISREIKEDDYYKYELNLPGYKVYELKEGETVEEIARKSGLSPETIMTASRLESEDVKSGEILILPFE